MSFPHGYPSGKTADQFKLARASTAFGMVMLVGWFVPFFGIPLGTTGLIFGIIGRHSSRSDLARSGIFLNALGLLLTGLNLAVSLYFILSGKIDPFDLLQQ